MTWFPFDWTATLAGFGIGLIVGVTGVGGGSLMTPLLISVFNLEKAVAIGTDLWFAGLTKVSGSIAHHRHGHVDYKITTLLLAGSIPASIGTTAWMHMVGMSKKADSALSFALGVALVVKKEPARWPALGLIRSGTDRHRAYRSAPAPCRRHGPHR